MNNNLLTNYKLSRVNLITLKNIIVFILKNYYILNLSLECIIDLLQSSFTIGYLEVTEQVRVFNSIKVFISKRYTPISCPQATKSECIPSQELTSFLFLVYHLETKKRNFRLFNIYLKFVVPLRIKRLVLKFLS